MPTCKWREVILYAVERARQLKRVQCIFQRPFAQSYWMLRQQQLCLAPGPAHMYADTWLTLRYATLKPQLVQWDVPCRAHPRQLAMLFKLYDASTKIPNYHARIKVQTSLRKYAAGHGIKLSNQYVLSVPHSEWFTPMRTWTKQFLSSFQQICPEWFNHHVSRYRIVKRAKSQ